MRGFFQPGLRTFSAQASTLCAQRPQSEDCSYFWPDEDGCTCWSNFESSKYMARWWSSDAMLPERVAFSCDVPQELKDECKAMMEQNWEATEYETGADLDKALKSRDHLTGPQV